MDSGFNGIFHSRSIGGLIQSFNLEHPVADSDMRLDKPRSVGAHFELFAQGYHTLTAMGSIKSSAPTNIVPRNPAIIIWKEDSLFPKKRITIKSHPTFTL